MEGKLIFCNDAVLRFQSTTDSSHAIALEDIQNIADKDNPYFFLKFLGHETIIERGTTLGQILISLEPWEKLVSSLTGRNVAEYIKATKKPTVVSDNQDIIDFDFVNIHKIGYITSDYNHVEWEENEDINEFINKPREPNGQYVLRIENSCCGYSLEDDINYSLATIFSKIKNLPVNLTKKMFIDANNLLKDGESISSLGSREEQKIIYGKHEYTLQELLEAIIIDGLFYETPQGMDEHTEYLKELFKTFKSPEDIANEQEQEKEEEVVKEAANDDEKPMKVEIAEGAFDGLIDHYENEKNSWEVVKDHCKSLGKHSIKIGKIKEMVPERNVIYAINVNEIE